MAKQVQYTVSPQFNMVILANAVSEFLQTQKKMDVQLLNYGQQILVQARENKTWKKATGMDKATTVKLTMNGPTLSVEVGSGKWMDKAAGIGVGMFIFWPILIPVAIGTLQQKQLPEQILWYIQDYMSKNAGPAVTAGYAYGQAAAAYAPPPQPVQAAQPAPPQQGRFCSQCGKAVQAGWNICPYCGNKP